MSAFRPTRAWPSTGSSARRPAPFWRGGSSPPHQHRPTRGPRGQRQGPSPPTRSQPRPQRTLDPRRSSGQRRARVQMTPDPSSQAGRRDWPGALLALLLGARWRSPRGAGAPLRTPRRRARAPWRTPRGAGAPLRTPSGRARAPWRSPSGRARTPWRTPKAARAPWGLPGGAPPGAATRVFRSTRRYSPRRFAPSHWGSSSWSQGCRARGPSKPGTRTADRALRWAWRPRRALPTAPRRSSGWRLGAPHQRQRQRQRRKARRCDPQRAPCARQRASAPPPGAGR